MLEKEDQSGRTGPPESGLEPLLAERDFVLTLARRMVSSAEAEDLVQEVWLAALRRPPGDGLRLRGWLRRVTRNLAVERKRALGLRSAAEAESASGRETGWPSAFDEVSASAVARAVTEEVLRLREPYRATLLAHYYEKLVPGEIALRSGESIETVRTRLKRGLALLRRRLDERHCGDARAALSALLVAWDPARTAPLARAPRRLARERMLAGAAAAVVLLLAGGAWITGRPAPEAEEVARFDAAPAREPAVAAASRADGVQRRELTRALELRVVREEDDVPVASASLRLEVVGGIELRGRSDEQGRASFVLASPDDVVVRVERSPTSLPHSEQLSVERLQSDAEVVLRVPAASAIDGVVRDRAGRPVEGATVRAHAVATTRGLARLEGADELELATPTDGAGRFALGGLPRDFLVTVDDARARVGAESLLAHLEEPARIDGLELRLLEPRTLQGRVAGPDGRPIEGALVRTTGANDSSSKKRPGPHVSASYLAHAESRATSDAYGVFELTGLAPGVQLLSIEADGFPRTDRFVPPDESWIPIELSAGAELAFEVFGADGRPRNGARVELHLGTQRVLERATDERGQVEFSGLERGIAVHVRARDDEHAPLALLGLQPRAAGSASPIHIDLAPGRSLTGRVLDEDGHPVAGAELVFRRAALADPPREDALSFWNWREAVEVARFLARTRSGPDGSFLAGGLARESLEIELVLPGQDGPSYRLVAPHEREIVLEPQGSLPGDFRVVGRVVAAESGRPLEAGDAPALRALESVGGLRRGAAPIRADGRFELSLPARGRWTLELRARGRVPHFLTLRMEEDVEDLEIELHRAHTLRLQVVDRLDAPLEGARLLVESQDGEPVPMPFGKWTYGNLVTLGAAGDAFLHELPGRPVRLRAWLPGTPVSFEQELDPTLVPAGEVWTWRLSDLELGRSLRPVPLVLELGDPEAPAPRSLRARALDPGGNTLAEWAWERADDGVWAARSGVTQRQWFMTDAGVFLAARDRPVEQERYANRNYLAPATAPGRERVELDLPLATERVVVRAGGFEPAELDARGARPDGLRAVLVRTR